MQQGRRLRALGEAAQVAVPLELGDVEGAGASCGLEDRRREVAELLLRDDGHGAVEGDLGAEPGGRDVHPPVPRLGRRAEAEPAVDGGLGGDEDGHGEPSLGGVRQVRHDHPGEQAPAAVRRQDGHATDGVGRDGGTAGGRDVCVPGAVGGDMTVSASRAAV